MTDPERLLESAERGSPVVRLLRAGAGERPSAASVQRALAAVGTTGAAVGVASGAHAAGATASAGGASGAAAGAASGGAGAAGAAGKASAGLLVAKWLGVGVLAGGLATGVAQVATTQALPEKAAPHAVATSASPPPTVSVSETKAAPPSVVPTPTPSSLGVHAPAVKSAAPSQLSAELAALQRAKSLSTSNPSAALQELHTYRARFPQGKLAYEASFLGMQTAQRAGRAEEARRYARQVLAFQPHGPQAEQARALLEQ